MCRWMGSHFHDWNDFNGVVFSMELLEWRLHIFGFWGVRQFFIFTVNKHTRTFVLQMKNKVLFIQSKNGSS